MIGGGLLIVFGVLSPMEAFSYINWETLGLLSGMFVLVSILHEAGFFTWLAMEAVRRVNYHPTYLFVALLVMAAVLAMFMDSITVMLFLSALTLQLCRLLKVDPVTFIIAEVCAANTGQYLDRGPAMAGAGFCQFRQPAAGSPSRPVGPGGALCQ